MQNFLSGALARSAVAAASILFSIVTARLLGPGDTGSLYIALAVLFGLAYATRLGNDVNLIWHANASQQRNELSRANQLLLASVGAALLMCVLVLAAWLALKAIPAFEGAGHSALVPPGLLLGALPALAIAGLVGAALKGTGQTSKAALLEQGGVFILALPLLLLASMAMSSPGLMAAQLAVFASAWLFAVLSIVWWLCTPAGKSGVAASGIHETVEYLRSSLSMGSSNLANYAYHWGNLIVVGLVAGHAQAGLYVASERIAVTQVFVLSVVYIVYSNRLATTANSGRHDELEQVANKSAGLATLGALPPFLVCMAAPQLVLSLFGDNFLPADTTIRILSFAFMFSALIGAGGYLLMLMGQARAYSRITWACLLLQLLLCSIGASVAGAAGAALGFLIVNSVRYFMLQITIKRLFGFYIQPWRTSA